MSISEQELSLVQKDLLLINEQSPVVHNITNFVVMNNTANALLAIGASPVMAHATREVEEITSLSSALVLNIGTLSNKWVKSMILAGRKANQLGIPVTLDPVGAGASQFRTDCCRHLLDSVKPAVIRGNASEIMALAGEAAHSRGVDSGDGADQASEAASSLAERYSTTVVVSGPVDLITDGQQTLRVPYGSPVMARVTGMGCTASALCAAFTAVNSDPLRAAYHAMVTMGFSGRRAAMGASGPGSLQLRILDIFYQLASQPDMEWKN